MTRRLALLSLLLGSAVLLALYLHVGGNGSQPAFRTAAVERGPLTSTIASTGTLNAVTTVQVGTQVSGQIRELLADFNSQVRKNQIIARIASESFEAQVGQARAELEAAQAGVVNQRAQVQRARADLATARAQVLNQRSQVERAHAEVSNAQAGLAAYRVWKAAPAGMIPGPWYAWGRAPLERAWIAVVATALVNSLGSPVFHLPGQAAIIIFALARMQADADALTPTAQEIRAEERSTHGTSSSR